MSQADGRNRLYRFKLEIRVGGATSYYNFLVNPDNYTETHPQRTTAFKTREASVVEDFGPDLGKIKFSGTTGFRYAQDQDGVYRNGADRLFQLEDFLEKYAESGNTTEPGENPNRGVMYFYNQTDGKSWRVTLDSDGFEIERTAQESLLYRYTLNLIILDKASNPDIRDIDESAVGDLITEYEDYKTGTDYANEGERYNSGTIYNGANSYNPPSNGGNSNSNTNNGIGQGYQYNPGGSNGSNNSSSSQPSRGGGGRDNRGNSDFKRPASPGTVKTEKGSGNSRGGGIPLPFGEGYNDWLMETYGLR